MTDHKFTDDEIIHSLKVCSNDGDCSECLINPHKGNYGYCTSLAIKAALDLINRQKAVEENLRKRIDDLEHTLAGVMWSVDKWLDGADLKQDEVNRAIRMREKTLEIVERLEEENEFLKSLDENKIRAEAIKEFAERLRKRARVPLGTLYGAMVYLKDIDTLVKEMTETK